jgi:hypothetical protein
VSLLGTLLAALTTWLSFGLLAVSSTPAVSNFGLSVSLGLVQPCWRPGPAIRSTPNECDYRQCGKEPSCP